MEQSQRTVQVARRQPPVALYNLSAFAMNEFARIVKEEKKGRLHGSELKRLDSTLLETPCTFLMYVFEQHKRDSDKWSSKPFYTAPEGYKLNLSVYANGYGDGKKTHVSVFLQLMPGEFDGVLRWPFTGSFTVTLLEQSDREQDFEDEDSDSEEDSEEDQSDNEQEIEEEISFSYGTPEDVIGRPRGRKNSGLGETKFVSHRKLRRRRDSPVYVKDNCICIQVKETTKDT